jgi:hypothetical protein
VAEGEQSHRFRDSLPAQVVVVNEWYSLVRLVLPDGLTLVDRSANLLKKIVPNRIAL